MLTNTSQSFFFVLRVVDVLHTTRVVRSLGVGFILSPSPEHHVLHLLSLKLWSQKTLLSVLQVGIPVHKTRNSTLLKVKSSLSSSIYTHERNVLLLENLHIQSSCLCVQLSQLNLYLNFKFKISTKSTHEIQVTRVKLSNFVSSSKFSNTKRMLICLFSSIHSYK